MRRFSQRSSLVTLSEINITPLLDLAFVLLIIFVITTPLLEQGLPLQLPRGGQPDRRIDQADIRTVDLSRQGIYFLNRQRMPLDRMVSLLVRDFHANPNLVIYIRADKNGTIGDLLALVDRCVQNGMTRMNFRQEPPGRP